MVNSGTIAEGAVRLLDAARAEGVEGEQLAAAIAAADLASEAAYRGGYAEAGADAFDAARAAEGASVRAFRTGECDD